jgi:hypothetical protein
MEDMERMQLYFRGHADGFSYLKKSPQYSRIAIIS